jgi:hypothetical protein
VAGSTLLREGQKVSYDLGQDRKTGKSKAEKVHRLRAVAGKFSDENQDGHLFRCNRDERDAFDTTLHEACGRNATGQRPSRFRSDIFPSAKPIDRIDRQ